MLFPSGKLGGRVGRKGLPHRIEYMVAFILLFLGAVWFIHKIIS